MTILNRPVTSARRVVAIVAAAALLAGGLIAVQSATTVTTASAAAYDGDRFQPGNIISDVNFYDGDAMTKSEIATFLTSKITTSAAKSSCASVADTSTPCLKDYTGSIRARAASDNGCKKIAAKSNQSAASIIATVAAACGISPKVILVTLQKEQGLVASANPSKWSYDHAMGWGCPDTADCETTWNGLFNQVYKGSWQFKQYKYNYLNFNFRKGQTAKIQYSPTASCGTKTVKIENWATAALYIYTPYTPNKAALANYPGTADCGAYGNRNFWAYYTNWFGDPVYDGYLIRQTGTSTDYLIVDDTRWKLSSSLLTPFKPYGPRGVVSKSFVNSFTLKGTLGRVIKNPSGVTFFVDNGKRYKTGTCAETIALGIPCASVPTFSWDQIALLPAPGNLEQYVKLAGGAEVFIGDGTKREWVNPAAVKAAGYNSATSTSLTASALASIPYGAPLVSSGVLFRGTTGTTRYVNFNGKTWTVGSELMSQAPVESWLGGTFSRKLSADSIAKLGTKTALPTIIKDSVTGTVYLTGTNGLDVMTNPAKWTGTVTTVPHSIVDRFKKTGTKRSFPLFVKEASSGRMFLLSGKTRTLVASTAARATLANKLSIPASSRTVPDALIDSIPLADPAKKTGIAISGETSSNKWFLDGTKRFLASDRVLLETVGTSAVTYTSNSFVNSYTAVSGSMSMGVTCGSKKYVQLAGKLHAISAAAAAEYPSSFGFRKLSTETCAALKFHSKKIGTLLVSGSGAYYLVQDGKKHPMTTAVYKRLRGSLGSANTASTYVLGLMPTGSRKK